MITISNSVFDAKGADKKAKVYGVTLNGAEDVVIKDCTFKNVGYSAILNHSTGSVLVEDCKFECDGMYNPIEGSQSVSNGNVIVKGCDFLGVPGNNFINFYQVADGSEHLIEACHFTPTVDNNTIRISNRTSAAMKLVVKDCAYDVAEGEPTDYTNFLLCQDYTSKSGVKQDFTHVEVELDNLRCNGVKVVDAEKAAVGGVFYVYEDGKGLITGTDNDPVILVK